MADAWSSVTKEMGDFLVKESKPIWTPFPNSPQELAFNSEAQEILWGGSAGCGKSQLALGMALTKHHRSLILRRQAVQVVNLVEEIKKIAGASGWRGSGHGGTMNYQGKTIEIGGCDHEDDKEKYQGRPHDFIAYDEAVTFSQSQFRFISAWNRHEDPNQKCQILCGTNPPTSPEGRWIIEEFAPWLDTEFAGVMAKPGELRWYTMLDGKLVWVDGPDPFTHKGEKIVPRSRTFIPGRLKDNPILSATDYGAKLQALPEPLRSQLLYGDFNAGLSDDPWQVIPTDWVRQAQARWSPNPPEGTPMSAIGVDVARGGTNKTVIAPRYGKWFAPLQKHPGKTTPNGPAAATLVLKAHKDNAVVNIDVVGVGSSAYDYLKEQKWLKTVPINNAAATKLRDKSGRLKFTNVRAASYWKLREALDPDGDIKLILPPDNELVADLCAPRYEVLASGLKIEPKEDIAERIGRSPDVGDAVVLAYWNPAPIKTTFRVLPSSGGRRNGTRSLRIIITSKDDLPDLSLEEPCLLVAIDDPEPMGSQDLPRHNLSKLMGACLVRFADLNPADHRSTWDQPIEPYNKTAEQLAMDKQDHGKKIWSLLTRQRSHTDLPEVVVICDQGGTDRRAESLAMAIADTVLLKREESISRQDDDGWKCKKGDSAANPHIYAMTKTARDSVIGKVATSFGPVSQSFGQEGWTRIPSGYF